MRPEVIFKWILQRLNEGFCGSLEIKIVKGKIVRFDVNETFISDEEVESESL